MSAFNSKLAFFENAFKKDTKLPIMTTNKKKKSELGAKWEKKLTESKIPASTHKPISIQSTNDDEKIDEYMIWTQYIDKNGRKPLSALQLSAFTNNSNENNIPSINMFKAKEILRKYQHTKYEPVHGVIPIIPKKKIIRVQPSRPAIASSPFHELSNGSFFSGKCQICLEDKDNILTTNKCQHNLCKDCMRMYIKLSPNKLEIKCPAFKCSSILSQFYDIKCVLSHNEYSQMYLKKLLNNLSYHQGDQMCFTKTCFNKIALNNIGDDGKLECCQCNESWCVHCKSAWHEGLNCDESNENKENTLSELLLNCGVKTIGYVSDVPSMRSCINCQALITHTYGCKHMYCIRCNTSFCFVCLGVCDGATGWKCGGSSDICPVAPRQVIQKSINQQQCQEYI